MDVRNLKCENCGKTFVCGEGGRDGGCWCMDLPPVLALPRQDDGKAAGDCLCPDCARERIARARAGNQLDPKAN